MTAGLPIADANHAGLVAAFAGVQAALHGIAGMPLLPVGEKVRDSGDEGRPSPQRGDGNSPGATPALDRLCTGFGLSCFERDVLLLCAGLELDGGVAAACTAARGGGAPVASFDLAFAAFPDAHWSALAPGSPLRAWRLIDLLSGEPLAARPLRIDERILHHLLGLDSPDSRLDGLMPRLSEVSVLDGPGEAAAGRLAGVLAREKPGRPARVLLAGCSAEGRRLVAAAALARAGHVVHGLDVADIPTPPAERALLARLWSRETRLSGAGLVVTGTAGAEAVRAAEAFFDAIEGPVIADAAAVALAGAIRIDIPAPNAADRRRVWAAALGPAAARMNGALTAIADQFVLPPSLVAAAGEAIRALPETGEEPGRAAWAIARAQARPALDRVATPIVAKAGWDDLVLPAPQLATLRQIAVHLRKRATVHENWGFAARYGRGLGITALFCGPSGVGKTTAAEVLATTLDLDLYQVDLAQTVNKYIGETEKNLARIFDAAEDSGAILLFDEADALFGKRTEVKDSHDRYANLEVSYLLQRMEAYRGLAVLTTNMRHAIDGAFLRRLRFVVEFPFPDIEQRARLWRGVFPAATPVGALDYERLARLNVAGGTIRNIATLAAFLAAEEAMPVGMAHLHAAAHTEFAKLERPLSGVEAGAWS